MYNSPNETKSGEKVIHQLNEVQPDQSVHDLSMKKIVSIFVFVILLGVIGGYGWARVANTGSSNKKVALSDNTAPDQSVPAQKAGTDDKTTFKDTAEGVLQEGGIEGEGDYHLERPGGESQNVYLTSATVDLSKYIGKKIKVWGETYSAQKAGWLMDVGRIEVSQ